MSSQFCVRKGIPFNLLDAYARRSCVDFIDKSSEPSDSLSPDASSELSILLSPCINRFGCILSYCRISFSDCSNVALASSNIDKYFSAIASDSCKASCTCSSFVSYSLTWTWVSNSMAWISATEAAKTSPHCDFVLLADSLCLHSACSLSLAIFSSHCFTVVLVSCKRVAYFSIMLSDC